MDLKTEDLINVEIDLSSELEKLNLGSIPNDFLDKISKFDKQPDIENIFLPVEDHKIKCAVEVSCKEFRSMEIKTCLCGDKLCMNDLKEKASVDKPDARKDINGNDSFADENLNNLITKCENLELSDSDNEEDEEETVKKEKLTERSPDRATAQRRRNRGQNNLTRRDSHDRSQFNSEALRHLSGSYIQQPEIAPMRNVLLHGVDFSNIFDRNQAFNPVNNSTSLFDFNSVANFTNSSASQSAISIPPCQNNSLYQNFRRSFLNNSVVCQNETTIPISCNSDSLYDSTSNCVNSPESGYDTSYSITSSPPQNLASPECFLDLNAENVNEQEVIDILLDFESENPTQSVPSARNLISFDSDDENPTEKIKKFLKGIPAASDASSEYVQPEQNQLLPDQINKFVETELFNLPPSVSSEVNYKHVSTELNDLLSVPSSKAIYEQVLKELINLPTSTSSEASFEHVSRGPSDSPPANSYEISCKHLPKEQKNLPLVASSEVSCEYVPLVASSAITDSPAVKVPLGMHQSTQNNSRTRLACKPLENRAKNLLRHFLCDERFHAAQDAIYRKINEDIRRKKKVKVIYIEDEADDKTSEKQTNLHKAVLNENIEEVYCLVEINKQYKTPDSDPFGDLNLRDRQNKTALDYAVQKGLKYLVDFLKENNACQGLNI